MYPLLGLGTGGFSDEAAYDATMKALRLGYRLIDTSLSYKNERGIGRAIRDSNVPRDEIFILTKCCSTACSMSAQAIYSQLNDSLGRLGLDYVDGYLIHLPGEMGRSSQKLKSNLHNTEFVYKTCSQKWPDYARTNKERRIQSWLALEALKQEKRVKIIGVSNFKVKHLVDIIDVASSPPIINQIEWHPGFHDDELREFCSRHDIAIFAYSSLRRGKQAHNKSLRKIGAQYGVGDSEVSLRWAMQQGISVIPRTSNEKHLRLNIVASQFNLSSNDMKTICKLQESEKNCRYCSGFAEVD